jgi:hypothetical protein
MVKNRIIEVEGKEITIIGVHGSDYISLTDIARGEDGDDHIRNWMRNRNTVEFLGLWETLNNPDFKGVGFDTFRKEAGLNSFNLTPKKWIEGTEAIGIISKPGRGGGTYAHKDIAFEFATWLSPVFKLYLITEFQRLKENESSSLNIEWNVKRVLSKVNYTLHTDAVRFHLIPTSDLPKDKEWLKYAEEADLLNVALFGMTARSWREANPKRAVKGENIRDMASINELAVLSNIESMNAEMIKADIPKEARFNKLRKMAKEQLISLKDVDFIRSLKYTSDSTYPDAVGRGKGNSDKKS